MSSRSIAKALAAMDERCEWSELPKPTCAHCQLGIKDVYALRGDSPVLTDLFEAAGDEGVCGVCGDEILKGDYIGQYTTRRVSGMMGDTYVPVYAHYGCGA